MEYGLKILALKPKLPQASHISKPLGFKVEARKSDLLL